MPGRGLKFNPPPKEGSKEPRPLAMGRIKSRAPLTKAQKFPYSLLNICIKMKNAFFELYVLGEISLKEMQKK